MTSPVMLSHSALRSVEGDNGSVRMEDSLSAGRSRRNTAAAQRIKIIVDQDARAPAPATAGHPGFSAIGQIRRSRHHHRERRPVGEGETQHALRVMEIAERTDVPVVQGAEFPLLNSKEETERWEGLYGKLEYKGCWTERFEANRSTIYDEPFHAPDIVPAMKEGAPHTQAAPGTAAEFIVKMVHKYPGEVFYGRRPLTNFALALKLDPDVATLARNSS